MLIPGDSGLNKQHFLEYFMELQRLSVKLLAEETNINATEFVPVFHSWIRNKKLKDHLMIDVADYNMFLKVPELCWLLMREIILWQVMMENCLCFISVNVFRRVQSQCD